jgi:aspartyl/glutamyl-tRNA(Asn/Gln) amidotransferase C subunit
LTHPIENTQTLREDKEKKDIKRDKLQELSKEKDSGFYITPKVIE